jgi:hypothetical protein
MRKPGDAGDEKANQAGAPIAFVFGKPLHYNMFRE